MGLRDALVAASPVRKQLVTLGKKEGLTEDVTVEVRGMMLGERSELQTEGFDRAGNVIANKLFPTALRSQVFDPSDGSRVWGDSDEDAAALAKLPGPAADKLLEVLMNLSGMGKGAGKASKNGSQGDES